MASKKTTSTKIKLTSSTTDGAPIPVLSFGDFVGASKNLTSENFEIKNAGTELDFTVYYDSAHKLIFVLDKTLDERTPNTLLVINSDSDNPDRKWDDILENDYNLDINNVRPKKDNKYQKLDIEYGGLSVYNTVINAEKSGGDMADALNGLSIFRDSVARRSAGERLVAAEHKISAANGTIEQTSESVNKLKGRQTVLREKLSKQRKAIGKEPTKESAAKILKSESQIDEIREKIKKATKRLRRAESRLTTAHLDAEDARRRLGLSVLGFLKTGSDKIPELPVTQEKKPTFKQEIIYEEEIEVNDMADENVTPLFNKDPKIINEEIAFKPITFDMPSAQKEPEKESDFMPPVYTAPETVKETKEAMAIFSPIQTPTPEKKESTDEYIPNGTPTVVYAPTNVPIEPVKPLYPTEESVPVPHPMQTVAPIERPLSPITATIPALKPENKKPTGIYYLLLIILIALATFTLWMYQKKAGNTTPNITTGTEVIEPITPPSKPFIDTDPIVETPTPVEQPQPIIEQPQPQPAPPVIEPQNNVGNIETPVYRPVTQTEPQIPSEDEVLNRKPSYNIQDSEISGAAYYHEANYIEAKGYVDDAEVIIAEPENVNVQEIIATEEIPQQPSADVYYNYEKKSFEPVQYTDEQLGEPDEFHEAVDSYESHESYEAAERNGGNINTGPEIDTDTDSNYYY